MNSPRPDAPVGLTERVSRLEASVIHLIDDVRELRNDVREMRRDIVTIRTVDFRLLFGAIIVSALGLAGILARGFGWL